MPSDSEDLQGCSSSLRYFQSGFSRSEVGLQNTKATANSEARGGSVASFLLNKKLPVKDQMVKPIEHPGYHYVQNEKTSTGMRPVGPESEASHSLTLLRPVDQDPVQLSSYFAEGGRDSMLGAQYENTLFSSSMSELFTRKLRMSSNNATFGNSTEVVDSHHEGEECVQSLEEIEAQFIGDLLPKDDDLFSGMIDDFDYTPQHGNLDETQELDFFSSVGGMDLGDDGSSNNAVSYEFLCNNSLASKHPYGEHPSRTLFVRNINSIAEDSELKAMFEQYGDIRTLYTACKHRGFVMVSYYDIRSAWKAMKALQNRALRRRKLDIHYSIPKDNPSDKDVNQGTLVVYNLDSSVSNDKLCEIFGAFGEIKEIGETPHRSSEQKFIEFYDVRAAEVALRALNRSVIAGKQISLEPSHPGVTRRLVQEFPSELGQDEFGQFLEQSSSTYNSTTGFTGSLPCLESRAGSVSRNISGINCTARGPTNPLLEGLPRGLQSLLGADSFGNQFNFAESDQPQGHLDIRGTSNFHAHSLPGYNDGLADPGSAGLMTRNISSREEIIDNKQIHGVNFCGLEDLKAHGNYNFGSAHGSCPAPGHHVTWGNSYHPQPPVMMWQNSPPASFVGNIGSPRPPHIPHGVERGPSNMLNPLLPVNNHVGSAPTVNPLWLRQQTYVGGSPDASCVHPSSLGNMRMSNNALHPVDFVSHNIFPPAGGNCLDLRRQSLVFQAHQQKSLMFPGRNQMLPMMNSYDPNGHARSRRNEICSNQADKRQFELDIERILRGEDSRTTLMIKNIPNKYTSKMLLTAIDECHKGTYDFIYLPIDFKNKCNVGYAFINMTEPKHIIPFYQTFNGKKWEKFNSEKVASIAYARIQGKSALIAHFQNSSLMTEDKRCRPILFNTEGPNAGDPVPFPTGANIKSQPAKLREDTNECQQESLPVAPNEENLNFLKGDSSSARLD